MQLRGAATAVHWLVFVLSRLGVVLIWQLSADLLQHEMGTYFLGVSEPSTLADVFVEYPTPAAILLQLPYRLGATSAQAYALAWLCLMAAVDVAIAVVLARHRTYGAAALVYWSVFMPVLGPFVYARFDLIVVLCLAVALVHEDRPAVVGVALAAATALKLWPALLVAGLLLYTRWRWQRAMLLAYAAAGALVVAVSVAVTGWPRLLTPLVHQRDRGLEIEAVWATPAMVERALDGVHALAGAYGSIDLRGPWVPALLWATTVTTVLLLAGWAVLAVRARPVLLVNPRARVLASTALLGVFLVTGKVLSAQYVVWLAPGLALLHGWPRLRALGLGCAALTQLDYPFAFSLILRGEPGMWTWPAVALAARNLALLLLVGGMLWQLHRLRHERGRRAAVPTGPAALAGAAPPWGGNAPAPAPPDFDRA